MGGLGFARTMAPRTRAPTCPSCGAMLLVHGGGRVVRCQVCGKETEARSVADTLIGDPPPQSTANTRTMRVPPSFVPMSARPPSTVTTPQTRRAIWALTVIPLLLAMLGATLTYCGKRATSRKNSRPRIAGQLRWSDAHEAPLPATIDDDEVEDVVGFVTVDQRDYLAAFSGESLKELWRAGPFTQADLARIAVVGDFVVLVDDKGSAHLLEEKTGAESGTIALPHGARWICVPNDTQAFVELTSGVGMTLDVKSGKARPGQRPNVCPAAVCNVDHPTHAGCTEQGGRPWMKGFNADRGYSDGKIGVAIGSHLGPPPVPTLVGYDVATLTVSWESSLADEGVPAIAGKYADFVAGRFVTTYAAANGQNESVLRVSATTGTTGKRIWDVPIGRATPNAPQALTVTSARVYVVNEGLMQVLDAKTGEPLGTVGSP